MMADVMRSVLLPSQGAAGCSFRANLALFSAPCQSASGALALRPDFTFSVMPGLVPGIHVLLSMQQDVDGRDTWAKTHFALLPGHDELEENDHGDPQTAASPRRRYRPRSDGGGAAPDRLAQQAGHRVIRDRAGLGRWLRL